MSRKVVWTKSARASLDAYREYIAQDAPEASKKVKANILKTARKLATNPYLYQVDEYYPHNDGSIRRFFRWRYRVVYQVKEQEVVILNVYHTSIYPRQIR